MNSRILILFLIIASSTYGQRTKKIVVDDYDLFCRNEYHVLKKDKMVKHGSYKSTWVTGNPREEGYYSFGKKDSLWTYFDPFKPIISSRGYYEDGEKVGVWEYFNEKEVIMNRYDHTTKYLSYTTYSDTILRHTVRIADSTFEAKLQRPPIFLIGEKAKFRIIQDNIVYPKTAIEQNVFGTVMVSFYVNLEGKAVDHELIKQIGGGCDEEALRVVKLIPDEWIPGIYGNKAVEVRIIVPITFQLN